LSGVKLNILFIGDVFGKPGRRILTEKLSGLVEETQANLVVVNTENAAGGFGMSKQIHDHIAGLGVDVMTTGNHVWDRKEFLTEIDNCERLIRPDNFPEGVPGIGWVIVDTDEGPAAVLNLAGRVFMAPSECPFRAADRFFEDLDDDVKIVLVDFHAEATSEKEAMGYYLDGRATAVVGTHTHVTTADEKVLPNGTAYITDAGMTGPSNSVIGVKTEPVLERFLKGIPKRFETASGVAELNGVHIKCDPKTGKAVSIKRVHSELLPNN
jgi:2',3'-cyclic-nucleotide 2'-phosphodiesterase